MQSTPKQRAIALLVGSVLCLQFWALAQAASGYRIAFLPPYGAFTPGELSLAMAFAFFLFPGGALIGFAASPWISKAVNGVVDSVRRASRLEIGVGLALAYAMFVTLGHLGNDLLLSGLPITDDHGIHIVGPIHYSDCVVPPAIVAVHGIKRLALLPSIGSAAVVGPLVGALTLGILPFSIVQLNALHNQARVQEEVHEFVATSLAHGEGEHSAGTKSIMLVPPFHRVWLAVPELARNGTWVHEWQRPRPDFQDDVIYVLDAEGSAEIAAKQFPERPIYHFALLPKFGIFRIK